MNVDISSVGFKIGFRAIELADLPAIMAIEEDSFPTPWNIQEFKIVLSSTKNVGFIAEIKNKVVGYIIFNIKKNKIRIVNIAVASHERRQKIGTMLVLLNEGIYHYLQGKVRPKIVLTTSDENLYCHLFFRALGFKAKKVLKDFYGIGHDAYNFVYEIKE